ncbi:hypothetical protein [Xanthomonas albilineans]|uniref:hypothetical protein n=2 Tax=Xanthomonas albilineans TaxID=29447 RepID=UPI0005F30CE2|nr:hypothetical protein [Xanthomonas albilineans]
MMGVLNPGEVVLMMLFTAWVVAHIGRCGLSETTFLMFFFAAFAASGLFGLSACHGRMVDHYLSI